MIKLELAAKGAEQEIIKKYLEENASETLAEKINNGVKIVKDGKTLINKKTIDGFMRYANEEARKLAEKGARCACIEDKVVFGWAIHYFEEESIEEALYNEDGTPYKTAAPAPKAVTAPPKKTATKPKEESSQMSLFDFSVSEDEEPDTDDADTEEEKDDEPFEALEGTFPAADEDEDDKKEVVENKPQTLYDKYKALEDKYPTAIIAMRVGDFYEVFGEAAVTVAEHLELTLTSRDFGLEERVKMVGFPFHRIDLYREKIRDFASVAFVENADDIKFYLRHIEETPDMVIDTTTGEAIEEKRSPAVDDLIGILFGILKTDLEDKR